MHTEVESRATWGRYLEEREFTNGWLGLSPRCVVNKPTRGARMLSEGTNKQSGVTQLGLHVGYTNGAVASSRVPSHSKVAPSPVSITAGPLS